MTHSCAWLDSFIRMTRLIYMCDISNAYVWQFHSWVRPDSTPSTLMPMCYTPHPCVWQISIFGANFRTCHEFSLSIRMWKSSDGLHFIRSPTHCNTLQHTATHCNTLQHTATHCNTLQRTATHCNTITQFVKCTVFDLQHTAIHCNILQHMNSSREMHLIRFWSHCNTLQHTATHCNTLQHTRSSRGMHDR